MPGSAAPAGLPICLAREHSAPARLSDPATRRHCEERRDKAISGGEPLLTGIALRQMTTQAENDLAARTDSYFLKTKAIVGRFGDRAATYAVFMRRPVISAPRFAVEFLESMAAVRGATFDIEINYPESAWGGAGEPILYITGPLYHLVDLET